MTMHNLQFTEEELELISEALAYYAAREPLVQPEYKMYTSSIAKIDAALHE